MLRDAQRWYMLSMIIITVKKRYGNVKVAGVMRVLNVINRLQGGKNVGR